MTSRFYDFKHKEVINVTNGMKIGYVDDFIFDVDSAQISSVLIYGRFRLFGLLGREDDMVIDWDDIEVIGEDTILVKADGELRSHNGKKPKERQANFFEKLFM